MRLATITVLVAALSVMGSPVSAQGSFELVHVMPFGIPRAVTGTGDLAIYGISTGIMVVDVSEPASPVTLSRLALPGAVWAMVVDGDTVFAAVGDAGVAIVDLASPANPELIRVLDTPGNARELAVQGDWVFVADESEGFRSINLQPGVSATGIVSVPFAREVAISGHLAIVDGQPDVWLIDISQPENMVALATIQVDAVAVAINGDRAFIGSRDIDQIDDELLIYDLSQPATPVQIGSHTIAGDLKGLEYSSEVVLISSYDYPDFRGLRVVDVSDPTSPVEVGSLDLGDVFLDIHVNDHTALFGGDSRSPVVDIADPAHPVQTGTVPTSWFAVNVVTVGNLALVAVGSEHMDAALFFGIDIIDFSNPSSPSDLSTLATPDRIVAFAVDGTTVVLVDEEERLLIYDISIPSAPVRTGAEDLPEPVGGVALDGDFVFLADASGLRVLDIRDPNAPVQTGFMQPSSYFPTRLRMVGDHVYGNYLFTEWEWWGGGFLVIDVSDPTNPTEVDYFGLGFPAEFVLAGDRAYVLEASGFSGTDFADARGYDVSNSGNPVALDSVPIASAVTLGSTSMAAVGNRLLSSYRRDVFMIRTDRPWEAVYADLDHEDIASMATIGHHILVADLSYGLVVLFDHEIFVDDFETGDTIAWMQ